MIASRVGRLLFFAVEENGAKGENCKRLHNIAFLYARWISFNDPRLKAPWANPFQLYVFC